MSYDSDVRKYISKMTGLTGIESGHIHKQLEKSGQDYQAFDWKSMGENLYGHGHRTGGIKGMLKENYGVSIGEQEDRSSTDFLEMEIHNRQNRRTPAALKMDNSINARHTFKMSNEKGVKKWLKRPNMFDIFGIDDIIK